MAGLTRKDFGRKSIILVFISDRPVYCLDGFKFESIDNERTSIACELGSLH